MKKLAQGLISFLAMIALSIWTISAFTVPQPLENFYVADYANVINSQDAEAIRSANQTLEAKNGSQIVVATFDFLNGEAIDDVAGRSAARRITTVSCWCWQLGKRIIIVSRAKAWKRPCLPRKSKPFWIPCWNLSLPRAITAAGL